MVQAEGVPEPATGAAGPSPSRRGAIVWRLALVAATLIALGVLVGELRRVDLTQLFSQARGGQVALAAALSTLQVLGAATALWVFCPVRLPIPTTIALQTATSFANTVTPATTGGLALMTQYLRRWRVPTSKAAATVALAQGSSVAWSVVGLLAGAAITGRRLDVLNRLPVPVLAGAGVAGAALTGVLLWLVKRLRSDLFERARRAVVEGVRHVGFILLRQPARLAAGTVAGFVVLLGSTLTLAACAAAYGAEVPLSSAVIVVTLGTALGTATPVPGGIGAVETSLAAGLALVGVPPFTAVLAALLYRLLTFWVRVPLGWGCLIWLRRTRRV